MTFRDAIHNDVERAFKLRAARKIAKKRYDKKYYNEVRKKDNESKLHLSQL